MHKSIPGFLLTAVEELKVSHKRLMDKAIKVWGWCNCSQEGESNETVVNEPWGDTGKEVLLGESGES